MANDATADVPAGLGPLLGRVRAQLAMLFTQFLLGMAVNLIGEREETWAKVSKGILLGLHVLVAIGLIVGTVLTIRLASHIGGRIQRTLRVATYGIGVAVIGGILTQFAPWSDLWSFFMALGFIVAFAFYGFTYFQILSGGKKI
jgi:hypothetical protein